MKRRKLKPRKNAQVIMLEIYCKSEESQFESVDHYIFYFDKKKRRLFEETGLDVTSLLKYQNITAEPGVTYYEAWATKRKERSMTAYLKKIDGDFHRLGGLFDEYDVQVTQIGVL